LHNLLEVFKYLDQLNTLIVKLLKKNICEESTIFIVISFLLEFERNEEIIECADWILSHTPSNTYIQKIKLYALFDMKRYKEAEIVLGRAYSNSKTEYDTIHFQYLQSCLFALTGESEKAKELAKKTKVMLKERNKKDSLYHEVNPKLITLIERI